MKVIACRRPEDNGVSICVPAGRWLSAVTQGGFGGVEPVLTEGKADIRFDQRNIDNMVNAGFDGAIAQRWVKALVVGGETEAGALDMLRKRDVAHCVDHVVIEHTEQPDELFRDAWRLQRGRVAIDDGLARTLFARKLLAAKAERVKVTQDEIDLAALTGAPLERWEATFASLMALNLRTLGSKIAKATHAELRGLWPAELPHPQYF